MSKINDYIKLVKEQQKFDKMRQDNHYVHEAVLMLSRLVDATHAQACNEYKCKGIRVAVGHQYYRGESEINKIIEEHTGGELKVKIDHYDHWSGDDYDVSYIFVPVNDLNSKKEVKEAFHTLKKYAPNVKLNISFEESW